MLSIRITIRVVLRNAGPHHLRLSAKLSGKQTQWEPVRSEPTHSIICECVMFDATDLKH